jgi:magnesium transporter
MTRAAVRDLKSLEEDASFKAQKIQFLLDATLGLINLAQNDNFEPAGKHGGH